MSVRKADMNGIDYYTSPIAFKNNSDATSLESEAYKNSLKHYKNKNVIPPVWHHNGPCVPAVRRIFVNADGEFYPCEKIDSDPSCMIGSLDSGVDAQKAAQILNIGKLTEEECKECWATRFCTMCVRNCIYNGSWSRSMKIKECELQKKECDANCNIKLQ